MQAQVFNQFDLQNTLCPLTREMIPYLLSLNTHQCFIKYFFSFNFPFFVHTEIKENQSCFKVVFLSSVSHYITRSVKGNTIVE